MPCFCCGTCCAKYQARIAYLKPDYIADHLGVELEQFLEEIYRSPLAWNSELFIRHVNRACLFLKRSADNKQNLCMIHEFKPACCREWESDLNKVECQAGLKANWDLDLDSSGKVSGTPEKIEAFLHYILSLKNSS